MNVIAGIGHDFLQNPITSSLKNSNRKCTEKRENNVFAKYCFHTTSVTQISKKLLLIG